MPFVQFVGKKKVKFWQGKTLLATNLVGLTMFKKAFTLAGYNWKVMLKALICQVLILALVASLCFLIFGGLVEDCLQIFETVDLSDFLAETITHIVNGEFEFRIFSDRLAQIIEEAGNAIESIPNIWNRVEVSYVAFVCIFLAYRMLVSISDLSAGFQLQEFMTSNATRPFSWYFVKKFASSLKFVFLQTLLALPLDLFVILSSVGVCLALSVFMGWWAIVPSITVLLVLYSARLSYFAFWLPVASTEELGIGKSLTRSASLIPFRFWGVFWKTLVIVFIMAVCFSLSVVFGNNNVVTLATSSIPSLLLFFLLKCVNFVEYFTATNRPFFCKKVDVEGTERFNKKKKAKAKAAAKQR